MFTVSIYCTFFFFLDCLDFAHGCICSVQFNRSVVSDSLRPHELQHGLLSATNSQSLLKPISIELVMPSNHLILCHPLLLPRFQTFSASASFQMSQFFTSGGQSIGVSASASVLPVNIKDRFSLGLT